MFSQLYNYFSLNTLVTFYFYFLKKFLLYNLELIQNFFPPTKIGVSNL
jgi:hypothetical protein